MQLPGENMGTYGNGSEIEIGDYVVQTSGNPDGWDWGQIGEIDGDRVTVRWFGSGQTTTQGANVIASCTPFSSTARQWARREFDLAHIGEDTGTGPRTVG